MERIKLQKVEISELNILKNELNIFYQYKENALKLISKTEIDKILTEMFQIDTARTLYFNFGTKIVSSFKNKGKGIVNVTLTVSEAVILIYVCNSEHSIVNDFEKYVKQKYLSLLYQELINII